MDKAALANQVLLRNDIECRQDSNMDRSVSICARGYHQKGAPLEGESLHNSTSFECHHFSMNSLVNLLTNAGFQIVKEKEKSPSIWMTHSIIALLFAKPRHITVEFRKVILIACMTLIIRFSLFPLLWLGNLLGRGDCIWLIAKKT